jgi:hypothetical protein
VEAALPSALPPLCIIPRLPAPAHLLYTQALAVIPERPLALSDHCCCCRGRRCCCCAVSPGCHGSARRGRLSGNEKRRRGAPGVPRRGRSRRFLLLITKKGGGHRPAALVVVGWLCRYPRTKRKRKKEGRGAPGSHGECCSSRHCCRGVLAAAVRRCPRRGKGRTWRLTASAAALVVVVCSPARRCRGGRRGREAHTRRISPGMLDSLLTVRDERRARTRDGSCRSRASSGTLSFAGSQRVPLKSTQSRDSKIPHVHVGF